MRLLPYVIQEHKAKKAGRHYDLRIKYPTKKFLASWALPKTKVPKKPGEKVLAVRTSDHDMSWLEWEGTIPTGKGGAGTVDIVQSGILELLSWSSRLISFRIDGGPILNGKYALILYKRGKKQTDWLLIKAKEK